MDPKAALTDDWIEMQQLYVTLLMKHTQAALHASNTVWY